MRGAVAPNPCLVAALAGCMGWTAPFAVAPQSSLNTIATSIGSGDTVLAGERWV